MYVRFFTNFDPDKPVLYKYFGFLDFKLIEEHTPFIGYSKLNTPFHWLTILLEFWSIVHRGAQNNLNLVLQYIHEP